MKIHKGYLFFLIIIFAGYVIYMSQRPKETDWSETYHYLDKNPFGAFVTHDLMKDIFSNGKVDQSFKSLYESKQEGALTDNLLILSPYANFGEEDFKILFERLENGHTVLIGSESFPFMLRDTLDFSTDYTDYITGINANNAYDILLGENSSTVRFTHTALPSGKFIFPSAITANYFDNYNKENFEVLATDEEGNALLLVSKGMAGKLYLSTMPLAFTNYFVLNENTSGFAEAVLSLFPSEETLTHVEYYHLGRMESNSILRFILRNQSLRWAYFIMLGALLLFIFFEGKRRQRIIPVITPLKNTSLEFASTLGRLYYRQQDHANLGKKRMRYWMDFVRTHYNLHTDVLDDHFISELTKKSGRKEEVIEKLVHFSEKIQSGERMTAEELKVFEKTLNEFYGIT